MKKLLTNLTIFVVLGVAFSNLTACKRSSIDTGDSNAVNPTETANSNTASGTANRSSEYPPLASGLADADIELLDGTKTRVSEKKGKVVMLNLWGIWCGPCREEMPHLVEMQKQYADKGFEVIGLNIGDKDGGPENMDEIKKFGDKTGLNYTLARFNPMSVRQFYLITKQEVVPQSMIIDRQGHLRAVFIGGGQKVFNSMQEVLDKTMAEAAD